MSENEPGDASDRGLGRERQSGLSLPRDETRGRPTGARTGRPGGVFDRLRGAAAVDESVVARWFIPVALLLIVLFVVNIGMYISQNNELTARQDEIAALRQQVEASVNSDRDPALDRIRASVERLGTRLAAIEQMNTDLQALQTEVARQHEAIEALSGRMDAIEQASAGSGDTDSDAGRSDDSGSQSAGTTDQSGSGGEWVINLITVADRASAESMQNRLGNMEIHSRIETITRDGKSLHRVVVPGYESQEAAADAAPGLKDRLELSGDPWIARE